MDFTWFWNAEIAKAATGGAAVLSVLGFFATTAVSLWTARRLEKIKANHQQHLEQRKAELQTELEHEKLSLQKDIEKFKAIIAAEAAENNARRAYEYEARKRLYTNVEPLMFQLFEAAESAFRAVASLSRSQRHGNLPQWLSIDGYYLRSIIFRLLSPFVVYRLIQRSTNLVDMNLDESLRLRYSLLKNCYLTMTDDFKLAELSPSLPYAPNQPNWQELRKSDPAKHSRQGLPIGHLDRLTAAMLIGSDGSQRPMSFGEFDVAVASDVTFQAAYKPIYDVFVSFDFVSRPVLARVFLAYALQLHVLMSVYGKTEVRPDELKFLVSGLLTFKSQRGLLSASDQLDLSHYEVIRPYIEERLDQAAAVGGYVKF